MAKFLSVVAVALALLCETAAGQARSPAAHRGFNFVNANCARCHAIDKVSPSPLAIAPPFRTIHAKYPIVYLEEAFAEGIVTSHPTMPQFRLDAGQIADVIAYFKTLEK